MERYWNEILLPAGVYVYGGKRKQYIELVFKYNGRTRHEMFVDDEFDQINVGYIEAAGKAVKKIKWQILTGKFIFEHWFPESRTLKKPAPAIKNERKVLFSDFLANYVYDLRPQPNKKHRKPSTMRGYVPISNQIGRYFNGMFMDEIKEEHVINWVMSYEGKIAKKTMTNIWSIFSMACARAKNLGLFKKNLAKEVEIKDLLVNWSAKKQSRNAFDMDELKYIMSFADEFEWALFTFWVETGLRHGELISLTWRDWLIESKKIDVEKSIVIGSAKLELDLANHKLTQKYEPQLVTTKSESGDRYVSLSDTAIKALEKQKTLVPSEPDMPIFINPNTKKAWSSDKPLRNCWYGLLAKSGIQEKMVPYKFRNTFCVRGLQGHVDIMTMKAEMGHADLSPIINNYAKQASKKKKQK